MPDNRLDPDGVTRREFATRVGAAAAGVAAGADLTGRGQGRRRTSADASSAPTIASSPRASASADRATRSSAASRSSRTSRSRRSATSTRTWRRSGSTTRAWRTSRPSSRASCRTSGACSTTRTSTRSSSPRRTTGTRSPPSGRCRPASTSTSRSPRRTPCGKGRKMVEATARYNKIVQVGTMNRSRPAVRDAIKFIHEGGLGKVYMARGLCYKPRPAIGKYPDGPMAPGEKYALTVTSTVVRAGLRRAVPVEGRLRPVARAGAEAAVQPQPLSLQLALALGLRQRRQRQPGSAPVRHRALGPAEAGAPGQDPIGRRVLRRRGVAGDAEHADEPLRVRRRHDPRVRHARRVHERRRRREDRQPVLRVEGLAVDRGSRQDVAVVLRAEEREGTRAPSVRRGRPTSRQA